MVQPDDLIVDQVTVACTALENVKITSHDDAGPIVAAIGRLENLETLDLNGISLGVEGRVGKFF